MTVPEAFSDRHPRPAAVRRSPGLLLNVTPGPDMAYIAARGAAGGFRAGAAATLGITAGCVVHTLAAAAGLSVLLATSATAFAIVKWCGAAFLLYTGVRLLMSSLSRDTEATMRRRRAPLARDGERREDLSRGAASSTCSIRRSRCSSSRSCRSSSRRARRSPALAFIVLGTLFNVNSLFVNLPVAWLAAQAGRRGRAQRQPRALLHGAVGALFVLLAARLAALERN